ncbi:MAG: DegT/DnrJ/EryC1/StrS family aminotransferase [Deltaproteobacteria bacterium]|nr:DegT/DnrJ/EryC1/StrS family aminotransferase [Deltaproteobacteria bacterium]
MLGGLRVLCGESVFAQEEPTKVPLLELKEQFRKIRDEVYQAVREVLESQVFILGPMVDNFEREVSSFLRVPHALGVASGTDALLLSLMALGVKAGDRVVTVSYTFFSTGGSISRLGAIPIYLDIDPHTYNLDPNKLVDYLRKIRRKKERPTVIIPVHLFGQMADMAAIMEIARRYELRVVEDAAQALGARQSVNSIGGVQSCPKEWMAGTVGDLGCFSFYPSKNLGGFGDGGMVVTRDRNLAEKIRMLRVHGSEYKYHHRQIGICSRLDALQAAVLRVKLKYLNQWTARRRKNADRYRLLFAAAGLQPTLLSLPEIKKDCYHIFNQFVVRTRKRDTLREHLAQEGIGSEVYYPVPLHLQECYRNLGYRVGDLPESERAARETMAIPIYPELTWAQQRKVVQAITDFYSPQRTPRVQRKNKNN